MSSNLNVIKLIQRISSAFIGFRVNPIVKVTLSVIMNNIQDNLFRLTNVDFILIYFFIFMIGKNNFVILYSIRNVHGHRVMYS